MYQKLLLVLHASLKHTIQCYFYRYFPDDTGRAKMYNIMYKVLNFLKNQVMVIIINKTIIAICERKSVKKLSEQ